jgi:hypothetical protein
MKRRANRRSYNRQTDRPGGNEQQQLFLQYNNPAAILTDDISSTAIGSQLLIFFANWINSLCSTERFVFFFFSNSQ